MNGIEFNLLNPDYAVDASTSQRVLSTSRKPNVFIVLFSFGSGYYLANTAFVPVSSAAFIATLFVNFQYAG